MIKGGRLSVVRWKGKWRDGTDGLTAALEGLPAGRQDPDMRARTRQRGRQLGARLHQMLAVVQEEQHLARPQRVDQRGQPGPIVARSLDADERCDGGRHQL